MTADREILEILQTEYHNGATQEELAKKYHTTQANIQRLLSGQRKVTGLSLGVLQAMFPDATIDLHGGSTQSIGDNSNGNIQQIGANVVTHTKGDDIRDYQLKVLQAIIALDLDAKAKDAVLTAINQVK
jgi:transcriptional regulator with XRE-family HTH domain